MELSELGIPDDAYRRAPVEVEKFHEAAIKEGDNNNLHHRRTVSGNSTTDDTTTSKLRKSGLLFPAPQQVGFRTVTEWIDGATVQTAENIDGKTSQASTGFAWSLYQHTLNLFSLLLPLARFIPDYKRPCDKSLKKSLGRLFLWGNEFREGKLENVLDESDSLRESVIESIVVIANILLFKLAPNCLQNSNSSDHQRIREESHNLEIFVEKARIITENDYESDGSSVITNLESSETSTLEIANRLKVYVECLMELLPSIEETLDALDYDEFEDQKTHPVDFEVSGPAQPYVLKVYDKFPKADLRLMHRLGEANWQRHISLRKIENITEDTGIPSWETPKAVFVAVSLFHDSGLGSSLPAHSTYAATVASHSSFQSIAADKDNGSLRIPPTPKEVFDGVPFSCQICGQTLSRIKSRIDWRRHVFADLKPYICTFSGCKDELKTFPTRKLWEEHEFGQHRQNRHWSCSECQHKAQTPEEWRTHVERLHGLPLSDDQYLIVVRSVEVRESMPIDLEPCPLCLEIPGKSQRNFVTHVGKHMEAIALAALPREGDSTDSESVASNGSEYLLQSYDAVISKPKSLKIFGRSNLEMDNTAWEHSLYHNALPQADGLYHCPWAKEPGFGCNHKPERLKCNYDKFIDSHLKLYHRKVLAYKKLEAGEEPLSERHLKAESEQKNAALEELAEEEDWIFDCICGAYGQIDDGTHIIACDKCNIWQHSKCVGVSKADADREDFPFICKTCERRAKDVERAKTQPRFKFKIKRPSSSSSPAVPKESALVAYSDDDSTPEAEPRKKALEEEGITAHDTTSSRDELLSASDIIQRASMPPPCPETNIDRELVDHLFPPQDPFTRLDYGLNPDQIDWDALDTFIPPPD